MFVRLLQLLGLCVVLHAFPRPHSRAISTLAAVSNKALFPSKHFLKAVTDCELQSTEGLTSGHHDANDAKYFALLNKDIVLLTSILGEVIKRENPKVHEVTINAYSSCLFM
jgi:hypothetical protein